MNSLRCAFKTLSCLCFIAAMTGAVRAETSQAPFQPVVGQEGKDVVWVPTPPALVEKMLDMARVTPQDYVIDLGSGDGRNIIAAAKRGARGLGVEYNANMVEIASRTAASEGVADKAAFVQGDMYEADISQATVLALFLLPENLRKLAPKFLALRPGTRIVANHFGVAGWEPDETDRTEGDCVSWCTALLYIVPANVTGRWRLTEGELTLEQKYQKVFGTLSQADSTLEIENGRLRGDQISFTAGGVEYVGRVNAEAITGELKGNANNAWTAVRVRP
ncbi:MAG: class I SAM-dependent methyltransferase [Burkholderiales bacterium]